MARPQPPSEPPVPQPATKGVNRSCHLAENLLPGGVFVVRGVDGILELSRQEVARVAGHHFARADDEIAGDNLPGEVVTIWKRQLSDAAGFQRLCVAAFRSAGPGPAQ
jgi:hypothetical protein